MNIKQYNEFIDTKRNFYNEMDELIEKAWRRYENCKCRLATAKGLHIGYGNPSIHATIDNWVPEDDNIVVKWSETWSYGGYDEGWTYLSVEYVLNEHGEQDEYDRKIDAECEIERKNRQEINLQKAKEELERAQKKLAKLSENKDVPV